MENTIFGTLPNGKEVRRYTLSNSNGVSMTIINYGAIITSLVVPAKNGNTDVVLGFDTIEDYINARSLPAPPYFGAVIGRYCGRIKGGVFHIGDQEYHLNTNNNDNTLHGGLKGFDQVLWTVEDDANCSGNSISLYYVSPDKEEYFPGELNIKVVYTLTENNEIIIEYVASSTEDTIVNFTQHSYFNLDGHAAELGGQQLKIHSEHLLEIDSQNIPSGRIIAASDKGFDYSKGERPPIFGIDDTFTIDDTTVAAATLTSPANSLRLSVYSNQPAVHIYVGGNLFGKLTGKNGVPYHTNSGICFESQNYPDAPNHVNFPNAILRKGDQYRQKIIWKFDKPMQLPNL